MVMSWIWTGIVLISILCALVLGNGSALAAATVSGAQAGIQLALSMAGSLCLWTGAGRLMEHAGITRMLSRLLRPLLHRVFPSTKEDAALAESLSANICANFLGLGNAATPAGIRAAQGIARLGEPAKDELCRLVVLNTASIQLIPSTIAAVRAANGAASAFDIMPAVWFSSVVSVAVGLAMAKLLARVWR